MTDLVKAELRPLKNQVSKLEVLTEKLEKLTTVDAVESNARKEKYPNCTSLQEVCDEFGYFPTDGAISCTLCTSTPHVATSVQGGTAGRKNGEIFLQDDKGAPKTLQQIIKACKRHFNTTTHIWCVNHAAELQRAAKEFRGAGIAVARLVYLTIREAKSFLSYERMVLEAYLLGVQVGVKNHGKDFASKFVDSMHKVIVRGIATFLKTPQEATGLPPPFCIVADKMTALRRTGQLVGLLVLVEGRIKAVFVGCLPVVDGHHGPDVADNLLEVLEPYGITADMFRAQFTGQSYDGQYFHLSTPRAVCEKTGVSLKWALALHDGGHVLELCLNDCRVKPLDVGQELIDMGVDSWYKNISKRIAVLQLTINYGQKYEEVRKIAQALNLRLYQPQLYCDTRFAQAERKVYKNYIHNWQYLQAHFEKEWSAFTEIVREREARGLTQLTQVLEETQTALTLKSREHTNFVLVGETMCLVDVLGIAKNLSIKYQTVNQLPWELLESTAAAHTDLVHCASMLQQESPALPEKTFQFFNHGETNRWNRAQTCGRLQLG